MECDLCDFSVCSDGSESDSAVYSDCAEYDELDCTDPLATSYRCELHEGIKLELWTQQPKMRQVVNVIVALQRMRHVKPQSSEFGQDEVLNILMDRVIEARQVTPLKDSASYSKTNQVLQCVVCDQYKKTLVRSGVSPRLQAVTLKSGNSEFRVQFSLSTYASPSAGAASSQPVCLRISKSNLYLACTEAADTVPHLVLKEINGSLNTIQSGDPNGYDTLLFLRTETGTVNTFESVRYRGWFISTALDDHEPVEMCQVSSQRITRFELKEKVLLQS